MIKGSIQQEDRVFLNVHAPKNRASPHFMLGEIDNSTITHGDLILFSAANRTTRYKISKYQNTINQQYLIDIYRENIPPQNIMMYIFSSTYRTFYKTDYILGYKINQQF